METELEMAERHVREGIKHVRRQEAIVAELRRDGHETATAEALLRTFEQTLASHEQGLQVVRSEHKPQAR